MAVKKIIICSTSDFDADYRLFKVASSLQNLGFDVVRLGRRHPGHITKPSDKIRLMRLFFSKGALFYAEMNFRLFIYLLFSKVAIIYSSDLDTLVGCRLAAMLRRKKIVFDSHEYFPEVPELKERPLIRNIWLAIEKCFIPGVDLAYTVCGSIADIYADKYKTPFYVVRNAPESKRLDNQDVVMSDDRPFTILYQGAVNVGRGLEAMVEAMQWLPRCRLVIVGDGDIMLEIKELVVSLNVGDRVLFEGKKPFNQLQQYMKSADLGIVLLENKGLNYYYSLPNRLFDFIQAGLPILASGFPEISSIVKGYDVGVCVDSLEPKMIADVVNRLSADTHQLKEWKKNMSFAAVELTWENEFKKVEDRFLIL